MAKQTGLGMSNHDPDYPPRILHLDRKLSEEECQEIRRKFKDGEYGRATSYVVQLDNWIDISGIDEPPGSTRLNTHTGDLWVDPEVAYQRQLKQASNVESAARERETLLVEQAIRDAMDRMFDEEEDWRWVAYVRPTGTIAYLPRARLRDIRPLALRSHRMIRWYHKIRRWLTGGDALW